MSKTPKKISLAFKIVFALTIAFFLLYIIMFLVFGLSASKCNDADLKGGLGDVLKYHFSDVKGLFTFKFHDASNIIYFSLSGLLYFFIIISIIYVVVGILLILKKKRKIVIAGIAASLMVIFVFMMVATGAPKYWYIINKRAPFDKNNSLIGPTFGLLIFSVFYVLAAYVLYFYSVFIAIKDPIIEEKDEIDNKEEVSEAKAEEVLTEEPAKQEEPIAEVQSSNSEDEPVLFEEVSVEEPEDKEEKSAKEDKEDLKTLLKEMVRDIVRDEIARNNAYQSRPNNQTPNGFGSPLIVQYFNTMPSEAVQPAPQPVKQEAKEQLQPEVKKEAAKQEVKAPAPAPAPKAPEEKKPIIRIPFTERMLTADKEMQDNYNELKNEILSYGVNSRVSNSGDTFRLHRRTYVKITIAGLSLKLYFALNPDDYKDSTLPIQNAGHKGIYEEIPLVFKVKSGLSMRRCKQLIQDVFEKNGFEQGEIGNINWVEDLKNAPNDDDD